jgi:membrane protein DedA with SNARE-associated domain
MSEWIKSVIEDFSYAGLVFLMFVENVFPPIPSELIVPLAGFFSTTGELTLPGVIVAATAGAVLGALPLYWLGRVAGHARLRRWCERHGKWIGVSARDLDKSKGWFDRHGPKAVLLCRLVPGIRSFISIPAGMAEMPVPKFLLYTATTKRWSVSSGRSAPR